MFDFDFKSFCVDDFNFDFKIILHLIYDFKPSKSSSKSSNLAKVALQAAEQQLLIYITDCSCSQSYLILECFYQNSFISYVIDCQFSHRETSSTVCRSCHPCSVV